MRPTGFLAAFLAPIVFCSRCSLIPGHRLNHSINFGRVAHSFSKLLFVLVHPSAFGWNLTIAPSFGRLFALFAFLFAAHNAQAAQQDVDFSSYDVPLDTQIVNRIKAKVSARLGEGSNTRDRYFIIPFAYEDRGNHPEHSHSFISVIRVLADNKQPKLTSGLETRKYKNREFEAFTISWLPSDFMTNPNLCVFDGPASRVIPQNNKCPVSPGRNFTLEETIKLAVDAKNAVVMWGPYEIKQGAFDRAVQRKKTARWRNH